MKVEKRSYKRLSECSGILIITIIALFVDCVDVGQGSPHKRSFQKDTNLT